MVRLSLQLPVSGISVQRTKQNTQQTGANGARPKRRHALTTAWQPNIRSPFCSLTGICSRMSNVLFTNGHKRFVYWSHKPDLKKQTKKNTSQLYLQSSHLFSSELSLHCGVESQSSPGSKQQPLSQVNWSVVQGALHFSTVGQNNAIRQFPMRQRSSSTGAASFLFWCRFGIAAINFRAHLKGFEQSIKERAGKFELASGNIPEWPHDVYRR